MMTSPQGATRRIFLDVGGHYGETLEEVMAPYWAFDHVFTFEPDPDCVAIIKEKFSQELADDRLSIVQAGLSSREGEALLYGDNQGGGATILENKKGMDRAVVKSIPLLNAATFLRATLREVDVPYLKLNCEGAEVEILNHLVAEGLIHRFASIMADFDITKTKGGFFKKRDTIQRLRQAGYQQLCLSEEVMVGKTYRDRTANWLLRYPELRRAGHEQAFEGKAIVEQKFKRRVKYALRDLSSALPF